METVKLAHDLMEISRIDVILSPWHSLYTIFPAKYARWKLTQLLGVRKLIGNQLTLYNVA